MDVKPIYLQEQREILNLEEYNISNEAVFLETKRLFVLQKYFKIWRRKAVRRRDKKELVKLKLEQKEKLDVLMKALKKHQKQQEKAQNPEPPPEKARSPVFRNFKNRFQAQKVTIKHLNTKLQQKDRLIEELQLGIIDKDLISSVNEAKFEIRDIFADCSAKVRCQIAPPVEYNEQFRITTQKAPKIMQKMEKRALEREQKREIIQERKRIIQEKLEKARKELVEKKRAMEEEERKALLELMKERRRKEMELEKARQANKIVYLEKLNRAIEFRKHKLVKCGFQAIKINYNDAKEKQIKSAEHYKIKLLQKSVGNLKKFVAKQYEEKYLLADALFAGKIMRIAMDSWKQLRIECVRMAQVAEDFSDFRIQKVVFINWHRYVCTRIVQQEKQLKFAGRHYNRRILVHFFYQWRSLPAVMQLERAKEQKLKKWREKVWEILPDYHPPDKD